MNKVKTISLFIMAIFYLLAGLNHFINPEGYLRLIPEYLPDPAILNLVAGICEICFGLGLFIKETRKLSAWGIILMLLAFIPAHIYFIQLDSCLENGLCLPPWTGWFRLLVIHPLLIYWAYLYTSEK